MQPIKNKVIIWGMDDFNALGLLRQLGSAGVYLFFMIYGKLGYASKSKYCTRFKVCGTLDECYDYMMQTFKDEEEKPILISSGDITITYIDQHRDKMLEYFILPGTTKQGDVQKYIDKFTMTSLAEEVGILCPRSRLVQKDSDISGWTYPCLIKPSHMQEGHYNEFKFKICKSESELKNVMRFVRPESVFILQEFVRKEKELLVYGARMMDGRTEFAGVLVKDRWSSDGSTAHGYVTNEIFPCVDIEKIADYLERIDYYGPFSVEYGIAGNKAFFFEVNLRNDGTSHYFWQGGANIPMAYVCSCAGVGYSDVQTKVCNDGFFIDEIFDYENVLLRRISKAQWKQDKSEATIFKYFDKNDEEPYKWVYQHRKLKMLQNIVLSKLRVYIVYVLDKIGLRR